MTLSMPRGRTLGVIIFSLLLIAGAVIAAVASRPNGASQQIELNPTYNVHSSDSQGTRAFSLWLNSLGYTSSTLEYRPFTLNASDSMLLMLFPTLDPTSAQVSAITDWVKRGGTLVVAAGDLNDLLQQLGVTVLPGPPQRTDVESVDPSLDQPAVAPSSIDTYGSLLLRDPAWVPVLDDSTSHDVIGAARSLGNGTVYAFSTGDLFSNNGLAQPGASAFVLNLLQRAPTGSTVIIDEYHHGYTEQGTFTRQLFSQPWGQAILFVAVILFLFMVLTGRRFGAAVRTPARAAKRPRAEYARTLASLLQQRDQREWLRDHYVYQLKRALGTRFRVRSNVPVDEFITQLTQQNPSAADLAAPLKELAADRAPSDSRLIVLMREADQIVAALLEPRSLATSSSERSTDPSAPVRERG